jgi:hypothetical protein
MDFGKLFSRAWDILWKNAFLILLGAIAVLGNGNSGSASQSRYMFGSGDFPWGDPGSYDFGGDFSAIAIGGIVLLVIALILFGLVFWALGLVARGGMISAVNDLENGESPSFVSAFKAGWEKGWRLLGIGLVPAIPGLILFVIVVSTLVFSGIGYQPGMDLEWNSVRMIAPVIFVVCLFVPIMLVVSALQTFANRACMLEDRGVIDSYRRGWEVLGNNLGPAVLLFLLQTVINVVLGLVFFIPAILAAMCCLLWPVIILVQAGFLTFYSILWTLSWRDWVGTAEI